MLKEVAMEDVSPPPLFLALIEGPRALSEASALIPTFPLLRKLPPGDGHSVMTLPGYLATDWSKFLMRQYLKLWGYDAHRWTLGRNIGLTADRDIENRLDKRLLQLYETSGRKVSLVGWSLGGLLAIEMARRNPQYVRAVITLGSPIGDPKATHLWRLYEVTTGTCLQDGSVRRRIKRFRDPIPGVPVTAIYSKTDAIVSSRIAKVSPGDDAENIGIFTSHIGMGFNPLVLYAVADRLREPEGEWSPFDKGGVRKLFYH